MTKIIYLLLFSLITITSGCNENENNINFFGKVLDQNGKPVSGAKVHNEFIGGFLQNASGLGYKPTDELGNFNLNGAGTYIAIHAITHPDIYYEPPTVKNERNTDISIKNYEEYNTAEKAKVFTVWRSKILESVRKSKASSYLKTDGRIYTYDLTKGEFINERTTRRVKGGVILTEGANNNGQLHVSCFRVDTADGLGVEEWSYTLSPVNGGIQKVESTYLNTAPKNGYLPSITVERLRNSPKRQHKFRLDNQRFYFTSINDNQKYYGSLIVDFNSSISERRKNTCNISIKFKINLEGSGNLAVDGKRSSY